MLSIYVFIGFFIKKSSNHVVVFIILKNLKYLITAII